MIRSCLFTLALCLGAAQAGAQTVEDTVRWIYTSLVNPGSPDAKGLLFFTSPAQRSRYLSRRLTAFYEANDSYGSDLAQACLDFSPSIPGQDFDAQEIIGTLQVSSDVAENRQRVIASFSTFGAPAQIAYDFILEDGFWKLDDIAGPGWRLSDISCAPKGTAGTPASFCYNTQNDQLWLDTLQSGDARFALESWQANGHSCTASGIAKAQNGRWVFTDPSAQNCRLGITVEPDGTVAISDPDFACKFVYCGQRAVLDGLRFPNTSQVACTAIPRR